jgi:iron complex transport system ATP-binding protein
VTLPAVRRAAQLRAGNLEWSVNGRRILNDVGIDALPGEMIGLVGPNGSGKSTVLRAIYRALRPDAGLVSLDDVDIWSQSPKHVARKVAAVLQETPQSFDFSVTEIVAMGRIPHLGVFDRETQADRDIVVASLASVGLTEFAERAFAPLSGGEKQRVLVARALAQQATLLVLDEPTNHLDVRYQFEILETVKTLNVTSVIALHDLNLAATYCDKVAVIRNGSVMGWGPAADVLTPDLVGEVFGVQVAVIPHPATGRPHLLLSPVGVG